MIVSEDTAIDPQIRTAVVTVTADGQEVFEYQVPYTPEFVGDWPVFVRFVLHLAMQAAKEQTDKTHIQEDA